MKSTALFSCSKCGAQFSKWAGRCTECGAWGTVAEDQEPRSSNLEFRISKAPPGTVQAFSSIKPESGGERMKSGLRVWDELTGGFVSGSVTLFGGEPGIGKSTLLSQLALALSTPGTPVLYVTGEESPAQVLLRLSRLGDVSPTLKFLDSTEAGQIAATAEKERPGLVIIDSIQSLRYDGASGEPGSINQVKASSAVITETAKKTGVPVILVGQVTKDGDLAGPRQIEHLVDTVLMLEGDRSHTFRFLRVIKNRFGETGESALLRMASKGLEEVLDPSSALVSDRPEGVAGSAVACLMDSRRPLLVELQALVTPAGYGTPLRRVSGLDANRVSLLLAVLARRSGLPFADHDVFMNVVGGLKLQEPASDLAACLALASAKRDAPLPTNLVAFGEVGLAGELRAVPHLDLRLKEAGRLGFTQAIVPFQKDLPKAQGIEIKAVKTVREAVELVIPNVPSRGRPGGM